MKYRKKEKKKTTCSRTSNAQLSLCKEGSSTPQVLQVAVELLGQEMFKKRKANKQTNKLLQERHDADTC